jgi:ADP-ribose pyrophosphatase YjhB (NUDIX family)
MKICDNKSVGLLVEHEGRILLIERAKVPFGMAAPAGHVDDDKTFEDAASRELFEEVGLTASKLALVWEGRMENPCRRPNGDWHYWKVYMADADKEVISSLDEVQSWGWFDKDALGELALRTRLFQAGQISQSERVAEPGLEPVWLNILERIGYV